MKNSPVFFLGLFAALALSLTALVFGTNAQYGSLAPYLDPGEGAAFPQAAPGLAARGHLVYQDLGCAACHTQQVRRADFGSDVERGWGDRQSVARDYVHEDRVLLGETRIGPDLANFGARAAANGIDATRLLIALHNGQGAMPAYPFLFEERRVVGQRSPDALAIPGSPDYELAPTPRAEALAAYLLSLKADHTYPETRPPGKPATAAVPGKPAAPEKGKK
ncbi:MAG: cbb3-type cytochrome c oxidase subunit II [Opitutaceae bacterium]|jgi:cytochrome c oxidase cbb3-type subunit 2